MKILLSTFTTIFVCSNLFSQLSIDPQQNKITTSENGVINYQSGGVEGFQTVSVEPQNLPLPISEWDLNLCNEVLSMLEQKILISNENDDFEAIQRYQIEKAAILERKLILAN